LIYYPLFDINIFMNNSIDKQTDLCALKRGNERLIDFVVFITALIFYSLSLHKGVAGIESPGDATKFQYIGFVLGVPHSPGYPLYVIINWLWSHIPMQISVATKINLLSAVFAAGTLTFFRRSLVYLGSARTVSLIAASALAFSRLFWMRATEAGPGAMSYFLISLIIFFIIRRHFKNQDSDLWWALVFTFIAAWHDPLCLWLSPITILYIILSPPVAWRKKAAWLACAAGLIIGISLYLFIYIRSHQGAQVLEYVRKNVSVNRVFLMSLNAQFWPNYFLASPKIIFSHRLPQLIFETYHQLTIAGVLLGAAGIIFLFVKKFRIAVFLMLVLSAAFLFKAHLHSLNIIGEYWLFFMLIAYLSGIGLQWTWNYKKVVGVLFSIIFACLILINTTTNNRDLLISKNKLDVETLLLICPTGSNFLTDDYYKWQEILRYYNFTNPFIKKRKIKLTDNLNLYDGTTNFFISDTVKKQLDNANVSYVPISSNETAVLYIIGKLKSN